MGLTLASEICSIVLHDGMHCKNSLATRKDRVFVVNTEP